MYESVGEFEHEPLTDASNQIRLIQVQHRDESAPDAPLQVFIKTVNREDAFKNYRALSYQWGDASSLYPILLNNRLFKVQRILFEFLSHVSKKQSESSEKGKSNKTRTGVDIDWNCWWWVDALCIRQKDVGEEKTTQIRGMRETYSAALQTIVWLGPGVVDVTENLETLRLAAMSQPPEGSPMILYNDAYGRSSSIHLTPIENLLRANPFIKTALNKVFGNEYWTRVWIIQELATSYFDGKKSSVQDRLSIVFGDFTCTWPCFQDICTVLNELDSLDSLDSLDRRRRDWTIWEEHSIFTAFSLRFMGLNSIVSEFDVTESAGYPLARLIHYTVHAKSSLLHDYIYGMLSLTTKRCRQEIRPSYERSGCAVLSQAIRFMKSETQGEYHNEDEEPEWMKECERLAKLTLHNPFDTSHEMNLLQEQCTGPGFDQESDPCEPAGSERLGFSRCTKHCHALDLCRRLAITFNVLSKTRNSY